GLLARHAQSGRTVAGGAAEAVPEPAPLAHRRLGPRVRRTRLAGSLDLPPVGFWHRTQAASSQDRRELLHPEDESPAVALIEPVERRHGGAGAGAEGDGPIQIGVGGRFTWGSRPEAVAAGDEITRREREKPRNLSPAVTLGSVAGRAVALVQLVAAPRQRPVGRRRRYGWLASAPLRPDVLPRAPEGLQVRDQVDGVLRGSRPATLLPEQVSGGRHPGARHDRSGRVEVGEMPVVAAEMSLEAEVGPAPGCAAPGRRATRRPGRAFRGGRRC